MLFVWFEFKFDAGSFHVAFYCVFTISYVLSWDRQKIKLILILIKIKSAKSRL